MSMTFRKFLYAFFSMAVLLSQLAHGRDSEFEAVDWVDLMSRDDVNAILNAPAMSHEGYGWEEQLAEDPESEAYRKALQSFDVNADLIDKRIMLPGFIVPTAYNENRQVIEFFLVPFFGACIHLPPPPPNQIIHVTYEQGLTLDNLYDAHVVRGLLTAETVRNDLASSAYSMQAHDVSIYSN